MSPTRRTRPVKLALAIVLFLAASQVSLVSARGAQTRAMAEIPVSFKVENVGHRSKAPCPTDQETYEISGHIVAPPGALRRKHRAVTVYLHGATLPGEVVYRFKEVPGYDYAFEMARLGHASAVIDTLGYGASAIPNGNLVCTGGQADTVHQVIQALRRGKYVFDGSIGGPSFERVALAGHSGGGLIAQVEAYSFHDIDALITMASAFDAGTGDEATPVIFSEIARNGQVCARGGEGKSEDDNPLSGDEEPGGYFYFFRNTPPEFFMHDADPAVVEQVMASWERDPCGTVSSIPTALVADRLHLGSIDVPVLLVFGNEDKTFPADPQGREQKELFTGSPDVELIAVERAGHNLMFERVAPDFRKQISEWLHRHGF